MPDPVSHPQAQAIAHQAKASGLAKLLQSGPMKGQVLSSAKGQAEVLIGGKQYTLSTKGQAFRAGQQVLARLVGGQVSLAPFSVSAPPADSSQSQALASQLQQLGVQGATAQVIAQALLQAGVPLNKSVLTELINILPQISADQMASLAFLLSRGMPVNAAMAAWFTYILKPRPSMEKSFERLRSAFKDFTGDRELLGSLPTELLDALDEVGEQLERRFANMQGQSNADFEKEIAEWFKRALSTLESRLQGGKGDPDDVLLRLIRLLQDLKPHIKDAELIERWQALHDAARDAHESLTAQAVRNIPQQSGEAPVFFGQVPIQVDGDERTLEFRYRREHDQDGGTLDLRIELSALGPLHTHMLWRKPSLRVAILVESDDVQQHLDAMLHQLADGLKNMGFKVDSLQVRVGDVPETLEPQPLQETFYEVPSGLDMRA
ncbi:MAG: flagellar hook-length control protein FliK [Candidatus Hinthialibacter antarcticus]|nr:flagellar hook-length control protein FliK [Candidatus Hinthialibacter antarcticus]